MSRQVRAAKGKGATPVTNPDVDTLQMTEWQRAKIAEAVNIYTRQYDVPEPMVAVRGLSPEFMELAIRLDIALNEFRDRFGRAWLVNRYCERQDVPTQLPDRDGRQVRVPELERIQTEGYAALEAVGPAITVIEKARPVNAADRRLKRRANALRNENWHFQMNLLYEIFDQDKEDRRGGLTDASSRD